MYANGFISGMVEIGEGGGAQDTAKKGWAQAAAAMAAMAAMADLQMATETQVSHLRQCEAKKLC